MRPGVWWCLAYVGAVYTAALAGVGTNHFMDHGKQAEGIDIAADVLADVIFSAILASAAAVVLLPFSNVAWRFVKGKGLLPYLGAAVTLGLIGFVIYPGLDGRFGHLWIMPAGLIVVGAGMFGASVFRWIWEN